MTEGSRKDGEVFFGAKNSNEPKNERISEGEEMKGLGRSQ